MDITALQNNSPITANHRADPAKIDATATAFEAQFVAQMLGTMFATVEDNGVLSGGTSEEMYKSFLTDEYGKIIANAGGIGVADQVKRQMLAAQEVTTR